MALWVNAEDKMEVGHILFPRKIRRGPILDMSNHDSGEQSVIDHSDINHDDVIMDDVPEVSLLVTVSSDV